MKKPLSAFLTLIILSVGLVLSSCGKDDPKPVAEHFLTALANLDFATAKTYTTQEGSATVALFEVFAGQIDEKERAAMKAERFTVTKVAIKGDRAIAHYITNTRNEDQQLEMVKENGVWKVNFKKSV